MGIENHMTVGAGLLIAEPSSPPEDLPDETIPADADEWISWVRDRTSETDQAYLIKPDFMVGHFRGELATAKDYAGREILELVQNAADAAAEVGGRGRVRIEVTAQGLCVANTGQPFRPGGVRSLMTSHTSDKPGRQAALIGAKGLGFRALLNWSAEPFITSGSLEIGFSRIYAEMHAQELALKSAEIKKLLDRPGSHPVPILAFPAVGNVLDQVGGPSERALVAHARAIRTFGYDTVVAAAFSSPRAQGRALSQIREFEPNFLLFVESLDEIVLACEGQHEIRWSKRSPQAGRFVIEIVNGETTVEQNWICHRKKDQVPLADAQPRKSYELAIALRTDSTNAAGKLHTYFPTEVPLPFPALFHATLELDSHRKSLNADSEVNASVLDGLSKFYADFLDLLLKDGIKIDPIAFLTRSAPFPTPLTRFEETTYRAAAGKDLIPTMRGKRVRSDQTQLGPKGYAQYLPRRMFGSLALCRTDTERATLARLNVTELEPGHALKALRNGDLTITERAAAVIGIATHLPGSFHDRSLLLDTADRPLTKNNTCFPPPASGRPPKLPRWARAKFLHPQLWALINAGLEGQPRDRFRKLGDFGIHEFNSEGLITSLRKQAGETIKRGKANADRVRRELLEALFNLRQTVAKGSLYPIGRTDVACRDGKWRDASYVHLSHDYGTTGRITALLYGTMPEKLLATAAENGVPTANADTLADFFRWIGVHEWPAQNRESIPRHLQSRILASLPEDVEVSGDNYRQIIKRSDLRWDQNCKGEYLAVAGLEKILTDAPSSAIVAWLSRDPRFDVINGIPFWSKLSAHSGRAISRQYHGQLPDLVRQMISDRKWLDAEGRKVAPNEAMISPGRLAELFASPGLPSPADEANFGLDRLHWARGLARAGVPTNLSELSVDRLFRLLGSLHARKPSAELVRRLYLQVLELDTFDISTAGDAAEWYRANGQVQVRKGNGIDWSRPSQAFYLDRDNFPAAARAYFPLMDLPPRRNSADVMTRFAVSPLSKQDFSLTVSRLVEDESAISARLRARLKDASAFIKVYRSAHSLETQRLRRLEELTLKIVVEADLEFSLGAKVFPGSLEIGKYILDGDRLIVAVDVTEPEDELMLRAITAISDGLAELFGVQASDDFEKLLSADTYPLRALQLRRLLNNQSVEDVDRLLAGIDEEVATFANEPNGIDAAILARGVGPGQLDNRATIGGGSAPAPSGMPPLPQTPSAPPAPAKTVTALTITKLERPPVSGKAGGGIGLRIVSGSGGGGVVRVPDISGPTDAEQWAVLFEQRAGRFPIQVSRLQGKGAYGCDCLSFATEEDLIAFKLNPSRLSLVTRFIEVKSGTVRLTPNEITSAERHKKKYFIYRIQFDASSRLSAHLTIVSHPLSHKAALARECEIRIDEIAGREHFRLNPSTH